MNQSHLAKNGLQCVSNRGIWSTNATNSAFLLAFVTTPIDSAHSIDQCIVHAGLVLSAHAHNIEYCGLVKVVNNASGTRLAGAKPHRIRIRYQCLPSLDLVQRELVVFWLISPRVLYYTTKGLWGL